MTAVMLAVLVGVLFTTGAMLILQRGQIKLILGLGLLSHGVNLALFGTGSLTRGAPAFIPHEGDLQTILATQTFADFASRLGDENKARQVLANTNHKIALRVLDAETQKYLADGRPQIDYDHCKGCGICARECPRKEKALHMVKES